MSEVQQFDTETGLWVEEIPLPYYHMLFPWAYRRMTGWRDSYGRKAQMLPIIDQFEELVRGAL